MTYNRMLAKCSLSAVLCLGIISCSTKSTTATTTEAAAVTAVTTANSKLSAVANLVGGNSSSSTFRDSYASRAALSGVWETAGGVTGLYNGTAVKLQTWFIQEFDENFVNESSGAKVTFAGRISNALQVFCFMGASGLAMDASTNLPPVGTHAVTITPAIAAKCTTEVWTETQSITLTVTATTDTTYYDRNLSFNMGGDEANCPFVMLARINSTSINLAQSEDQRCQTRNYASKSVFHYDIASKVAKFHYISRGFDASNNGFEVYRGYLNETSDEAYVTGFYGGTDGAGTALNQGNSFVVVGKPTAGGTVALSAKVVSSGGAVGDGVYEGCVDIDSVAVTGDDIMLCTIDGTSVTGAYTNFITNTFTSFNGGDVDDIYVMPETQTVGFTDQTDIFN
jgi:hypothetical protein